MERVRIGLVGCGLFGESHLQAFRAIPEAEVAAVFDVDRERAKRLAAEFGVARVCDSLEELCALPELHAVDVVTPEHLHREPVETALARGKHVFVEKPLATNLDDCRSMIAAAEAAGRFLTVGHLLRFDTRYALIRERVASGALGEVVLMQARRNRPVSLLELYGRNHPAIENCIHDVDQMLWCVDRPVTRVRGHGRRVTGRRFPDTFLGVLEFEGGAIGVVETIWLLPDAGGIALDDAFRVIGAKGVADLNLVPAALSFWEEGGYRAPDIYYDPRVFGSARGALRDELAEFCRCVATDQAPKLNTGIEAARAVRVVLALIESAETDKEIIINQWD